MKTQLKTNTIISTRELLRDFSSLVKKPLSKSYRVFNHGKLVATVIPNISGQPADDNWWEGFVNQEPYEEPKKRITLKDLEKYRFHSGEKNLSQRIDEIVYGIKR